ncbi:MAG: hypothetical protein K0S11_1143 [Gammaproteobacteria bacterium]|jgi:Fic family protein|nr:hypothetical protein [Gammaproteobacteria bacterium]
MVNYPLRIIQPSFSSELTDIIIELEHLRKLQLYGDTPVSIFLELKKIFHLLESLGSARIEGNHTTLADYIETKIQAPTIPHEDILEVHNIEEAMAYIEQYMMPGATLTHQFIREIHMLTVQGLIREGDKTPGQYRNQPVRIAGSTHIPPEHFMVQGYMDELLAFTNRADSPKYDLLKVALAHHRFSWIHPFTNGNGRVVRLLTYAMLIKYGFNVQVGGRLLNPTAVFCNDRTLYYNQLTQADSGTDEELQAWCTYVLRGIRDELIKLDSLLQYSTLKARILLPALEYSKTRALVTEEEYRILHLAISQGEFKTHDVQKALPNLNERQRIYQIKKLKDNRMIQSVPNTTRIYTISFTNNYLIRGVIDALKKQGFISTLGE